ncbi:hypothetical protein EVAR_53813_1 [Eumeta japonica]|uniref:Uncharacterized protein n=1 Tax=Eumeta variegata TaxID=151549 RepID=A0A4C1YKJ4_EUMVA|nr:hypothetical protein EVAR_53813_1 [Eumeta japonica]
MTIGFTVSARAVIASSGAAEEQTRILTARDLPHAWFLMESPRYRKSRVISTRVSPIYIFLRGSIPVVNFTAMSPSTSARGHQAGVLIHSVISFFMDGILKEWHLVRDCRRKKCIRVGFRGSGETLRYASLTYFEIVARCS